MKTIAVGPWLMLKHSYQLCAGIMMRLLDKKSGICRFFFEIKGLCLYVTQ